MSSPAGLCPVCLLRGAAHQEPHLEPDQGSPSVPDGAQRVLPSPEERLFGHYEILVREDGALQELGRGAMGITYKALDVNLGRPVALKLLNSRLLEDESARQRFLREARAAARVRHPNVASVFHLGSRGRQFFYAMEFVEGESLAEHIKRNGRLGARLALDIAGQIAAGLAAIHKEHLVHRDIKSSNVMLSPKEPGGYVAKIIDLGLAKAVEELPKEAALSNANAFLGTPHFASPEQCSGGKLDIRSDLYSLGVTLWEMIAGAVPFTGSATQVMSQHLTAPLPLEKLQGVPKPLVGLLKSLLQKDPQNRPQGPSEVQVAVERTKQAIDHRFLFPGLFPRSLFRRRSVIALSIIAALTAVALVIFRPFAQTLPRDRVGSSLTAAETEKGIAVLPFENLSADQPSGYFADGVQDDLLTDLAKISALKVISRTSVMQYRADNKRNLREIASALGVANLLEGTIRKEGNRVRISTRLIRADTAETLWAESYDRDLTDIFAIQSEIAQTIAGRLRAKLSPAEKKTIWERPTDDLVAYDLYLQAKATATFLAIGDQREDMFKQVRLLTEATQRDPGFVLAYCLLARANDFLYVLFYDHTPERRKQAEAAVNRAMQLRPDTAEPRLALVHHLMVVDGDYEQARTQIAIAQQFAPNNALAFVMLAQLDEKEGSWNDAPKNLEKAVDLDPRNLDILTQLEKTYSLMRRYQDCKRVWARIFELAPDDQNLRLIRDISLWGEKGDPSLLSEALALPYTATNSDAIGIRFDLAMCARDWTAAEETLRSFQREEFPVGEHYSYFVPRSFGEGLIARFQGDEQRAKAEFSQARTRLQQNVAEHSDDSSSLSYLGLVEAFLGEKEDAIAKGRQAIEMSPLPKHTASFLRLNLAAIYAWSGEPDKAIDVLTGMMGKPVSPRYGELKFNPIWDPIRDYPRFQKLLEDIYPK
ncbi:MAG TPA: protein kinase [Chthoniobacterales bacterium]|nr:protein kinase [Chthoniobacterales bacterium]